MSPRKTTKPAVQTTLAFRATKLPAGSGKGKDKSSAASASAIILEKPVQRKSAVENPKKSVKQRPARSDSDDESSDEPDEFEVIDDSEEEQEVTEVTATAVAPVVEEPEVHVSSDEEDTNAMEIKKSHARFASLKDLLKDESFKEAHKGAMAAVGSLTDSARGERKAKTILRVFDLTYEYGPCVGFTRMERWKRASKLGKNPPEIVRVILETGKEDKLDDEELAELEQSVFYGMV